MEFKLREFQRIPPPLSNEPPKKVLSIPTGHLLDDSRNIPNGSKKQVIYR